MEATAGEPSVERRRLEAETLRVGRELAAQHPAATRHPWRSLDAKAIELSARDAELRAALFRLVEVTPACRSLDDLARHLGSFLKGLGDRPPPVAAALRMAETKAGRTALGAAAAAGVRHIAHRFVVGDSPAAAMPTLARLWRDGIGASLDLLGEATVTSREADRYADRCAEALDVLVAGVAGWPERPRLEHDSAGPLARANLSVKVSALTPLLRADAPARGRDDAAVRLRPLLRWARDLGAHLHVDMESLDSHETTLELLFELLAEGEFRAGPSVGLVLQAYLRDSAAELERVLAWARAAERDPPLVVRLVKGAYWDHEVVEARQHGWEAPVFEDKADCDRNFEVLSERLLDQVRIPPALVRVAIGSHNLRSVAHVIAYDRLCGGDGGDIEFQVLRGLGDDLAEALSGEGLRVRAYCPVGDLVAGMSYLVRRLLENTANESFLRVQASGAELDELLSAP
ncbi:MAG: proline dehydrogenase family protein [Thermoleophilaceae bacterium]|nr:proline dehydrogenase family protein [Thermoleophilaceae bacterium]